MFDKLRKAFSNAAKSLGEKELNEKDIEDILFELEIALLESDVATEVIDSIKSDLKEKLIGSKVDKNEVEKFVKDSLISNISTMFDSVGNIDLLEKINEKKKQGQPFLILFVGINGTGKTTSLAKVAYMLQQAKCSVVIAAADTFRAGAIEQLREHANRLNLKLVAQNYESDPAAVARDAVLYAKSHKTDCVLIDTAGRMYTKSNLLKEMEKIVRVSSPNLKIFVGESITGNDATEQAKTFEHGSHLTVYLSPKDYHRVHCPLDAKLVSMQQVPGKLFSVNPASVNAIDSLFARNERVICTFETKQGKMAVIFVGAMLVGSIVVNAMSYPCDYQRGDDLGHFKFGSTVIVLTEWQHDWAVREGDAVLVNQAI